MMGTEQGTEPIENTADVIDSRDIIARIEYLRDSRVEATGEDPDTYALSEDDWAVGIGAEEAAELVALQELAGQCQWGDWEYGTTLIRDSYFEDYARELAHDIGAVNGEAGWPNSCIDWAEAASQLRIDYADVDFNGITYWLRA